jgi:hypothetical protein
MIYELGELILKNIFQKYFLKNKKKYLKKIKYQIKF